jgi:hypothetical protein
MLKNKSVSNVINKTCFILIILIVSTVVYGQNNNKYEDENFNDYTRWEKNIDFYGIQLKKVRYRIKYTDTVFVEGVLKQPTIINSYTFHKKVKFTKHGELLGGVLKHPTIINGYTFHKWVTFTKHGELLKGVLNGENVIDGYSCHKEIFFTKDGELSEFTLSQDDTIAGHIFKKNTHAYLYFKKKSRYFNEKGFRLYCPNNPVIQGYKCNGTNYKFRDQKIAITLYHSGKLMYFPPKHKIEIDGVRIRPSAARGHVHLYESGKLKQCTSAKEQIIQGREVEKNFELRFDEKGNLIFNRKMKIFGKKRWHD